MLCLSIVGDLDSDLMFLNPEIFGVKVGDRIYTNDNFHEDSEDRD